MINFIEVPVCAKRTIQTGKSIPCSAERKKIKHLSKYWGSRRHRTTPAGQILGVATPATPVALTPMRFCDVNARHDVPM